jgi:hypothetical protein
LTLREVAGAAVVHFTSGTDSAVSAQIAESKGSEGLVQRGGLIDDQRCVVSHQLDHKCGSNQLMLHPQ